MYRRFEELEAGRILQSLIMVALLMTLAPIEIAGARSLEDDGWELVYDQDGIQVHRRLTANSPVVETLTRADFEAMPAEVFSVVTDYSNYSSFMPNIAESRVIAQNGNVQTLFQRIRISELLSFLIKDRYHVVTNRLVYPQPGEDNYRVEWSIDATATYELGPGNAIATQINTGYWDIKGANGGLSSQVNYYLYSDPGGSIPKSLVNSGTTQSIPAVIRAIRDRLAAR